MKYKLSELLEQSILYVWLNDLKALENKAEELEKAKNAAYLERNQLVCALSKAFAAWLERHPDSDKDWEDDWRWIVFIDLPTGQATWHIHDSELPLFSHLETRNDIGWDGHTTEEKYKRLAALTSDSFCGHII